ncbi:phage holin family protein [Patulibacter defluvii]|uniref:phage holin family protein n=1 Tax=Patulibacter defluvii TaxID=3095358 RepID=UPI002A7614DA|nr:phage holin family protein [Patulibacter sp. DM4]
MSAGEDQRREASLKTVVENLAAVTERTQHIVRDEIELAKAEVAEKVGSLGRGAAVGLAAGVFIALGGLFFLHGLAWLFAYTLFDNNQIFWGFFILSGLLFLLAAVGGLLAYKFVKKGAPPVPTQAIEEAKLIRESVSSTGPASLAPPGTPGGGVPPATIDDKDRR